MSETEIGKVIHYFDKIGVAVLKLNAALKVGATIHILGPKTDFQQPVDSMQVEHESIEEAKAGESVGLKALEPVREGDKVFTVGA
ncbi:MAG: hypothetical protein Q8N84_01690 [bacterium]|nr:hypothetical protein [bacterium]